MGAFEEYLGSKEVATDPSQLRDMGCKAAAAYVMDGKPLNDSIRDMAKQAGLTSTQVERVVEFANNDTFARLFKANFQGNITFPLADTKSILSSDQQQTKTASVSIPTRGTRYIPGQEGANVEDLFRTPFEKTAAPAVGNTKDVTKQFFVKQAEVNRLNTNVNALAIAFDEGLVRLHDTCKLALREGASTDVVGAVVMKTASARLLEVLKDPLADVADFGYLGKTAMMGMEPVPSPVTGLVQNLEEVSSQLVVASQQLQQTQISVDGLLSTLRGDPDGAPPDVASIFGQPGATPSALSAPPMPPGSVPSGAPAGPISPQA